MTSKLPMKYSKAIELIQKCQLLPIGNLGFRDITLMSTSVIAIRLFAIDFIDSLRIFKSIDYEEKPKLYVV